MNPIWPVAQNTHPIAQPAWLLISLPIGARLGSLLGLGELLGLLLAVPVASCGKTFLDAWAQRLRAGELAEPLG